MNERHLRARANEVIETSEQVRSDVRNIYTRICVGRNQCKTVGESPFGANEMCVLLLDSF